MTDKQSTSSPLRVGIIGVGGIGEIHVKAYQTLPQVEIVAVTDPNQARAKQIAGTYNIPQVMADYNALIALPEIDAVSICTPNHLHAPAGIAALHQGKHVLCEKPLARTGEEAATMVQAARAAQRVLQVAFNHRRRGDVQVLKHYLAEGHLGRIYHAKASWMRRRGIPGLGGWFTNKEMAGGGPLIDLGVHVLDLALYLLDEPDISTVSAATYAEIGPQGIGDWGRGNPVNTDNPYEVEDLATAFVRLHDGGTLLLEASWAAHGSAGDDFGITLYGSHGGAEIAVKNYGWENTLRIFTDVAGAPSEVRPQVRKGEGHTAVVRDFVATIASGDWRAHDGSEGLKRTRVIDACYASALGGREVQVNEAVDQPEVNSKG